MCRRRSTAVLIAGLLIATPAAGRDDARGVLAKARDYVAWYDRQLVALIARRTVRADGQGCGRDRRPRRACSNRSSGGWRYPPCDDTIGVREVRRVDGRPVASSPSPAPAARSGRRRTRRARCAPFSPRAPRTTSATCGGTSTSRRSRSPTCAARGSTTRSGGSVRSGDHLDLHFEERDRSTLVRTPDGRRSPARGPLLRRSRHRPDYAPASCGCASTTADRRAR